MLKPQKINWKDTNLALIGSDLDKKIKKAAAEGEPQWTDVGNNVQLKVWRIEQFVVKSWPKSKYGKFHTGDSYVICNSYKPDPSKPKLAHDVHIWIGDESSQDEYGTAAYKMTELDDKLGGIAVHHREVQHHESEKFVSYFHRKMLTYLPGGVESGFTHVEANVEEPHLYHVKGTRKGLILKQEPLRRDSMNGGDVFILVAGEEKVWLWVGAESNKDEKAKGLEVARDYCKHGSVVTLDQGVNDGETEAADFWKYMPASVSTVGPFKKKIKVQEADGKDEKVSYFTPLLFQLPSSTNGSSKKVATAKMTTVGALQLPKFKRSELKPKNGYILDTGFHIYIWLGNEAPATLKNNAVLHSTVYEQEHKRPPLPLSIVKAGFETSGFNEFFTAPPTKKGSGASSSSGDCGCTIM